MPWRVLSVSLSMAPAAVTQDESQGPHTVVDVPGPKGWP